MTATTFTYPNVTFRVTHEATAGDQAKTANGLELREANWAPTTLTTIKVEQGTTTQQIFLYWEPPSTQPEFHLAFVPETCVLFLGGGRFSASVDLQNMQLIHQHEVELLWDFQFVKGFLVELGESECFLHRPDGTLVGSASVDSPYEIREQDDGVEFVSTNQSSPKILFASAPTTAESEELF